MTDLRHGALFLDDRCPGEGIVQGGYMSTIRDKSVDRFEDAVGEHALPRGSIDFEVEVSGIYTRRTTPDVPSDQVSMSGGELIVQKVWTFRYLPHEAK
jgi:hypothetical protein